MNSLVAFYTGIDIGKDATPDRLRDTVARAFNENTVLFGECGSLYWRLALEDFLRGVAGGKGIDPEGVFGLGCKVEEFHAAVFEQDSVELARSYFQDALNLIEHASLHASGGENAQA